MVCLGNNSNDDDGTYSQCVFIDDRSAGHQLCDLRHAKVVRVPADALDVHLAANVPVAARRLPAPCAGPEAGRVPPRVGGYSVSC